MKILVFLIFNVIHFSMYSQCFIGTTPDSTSINVLSEFFWKNPSNDDKFKWKVVVKAIPSTRTFLNNNFKNQIIKVDTSLKYSRLRESFSTRIIGGDVISPNMILEIYFNSRLLRRFHIIYNHHGKNHYGGVVDTYFGFALFEEPAKFIEAISAFEIEDL